MKPKISASKIKLSFWFVLVLPLVFFTGYMGEYIAALVSAAIHELGHIAVARYRGCSIRSVRMTPAGMNAEIDSLSCSRRDLILIYISGPAVNALIALVSFLLYDLRLTGGSWSIKYVALLNLFLAVFNLLPAVPLDGGKILLEALTGIFGIMNAERYSTRAAVFLALLFIAAGLCQLVASRGNFSLLVIGIFVLASLMNGRMEAAFMNIKQIIYRRQRIQKKGIYPVRNLVAMKWMSLNECVKYMDYDRFHMVHVIDENMTEIAYYTEGEIIEAMLANTGDITFEQLINSSSSSG